MVDFQLNNEQRDLAIQLSNYSKTIKQAYEGALFSIYQKDDPDRFVHFAHSLREVIDLLAKLNPSPEKWKENREIKRKSLLQSVIDPIGKQAYAYDTEYQTLSDEYSELSSIAHHATTITEDKAIQKLNQIESILKILTIPQIAIYDEIDEIISESPTDENAEKLKSFQIRWATNSYLIENLPIDWLTNMINVGFFENPQPAILKDGSFPIYQIWPPSRYLIRCAEDFPDKAYDIISKFNFKNDKERNPAIYADFLECLSYMPISNIEKIAQKTLDEKWYNFIGTYFFTEKYVQITEKLFLENKYDIAIKLLEHIFYPKLSENKTTTNMLMEPIVYQEVEYPFENFWFEKHFRDLISKFTPINPLLIIKSLVMLLAASVELDIRGKKIDKKHDRSSGWRPAIEENEQNYGHNIKSLFVTHLTNTLVHLGSENLQLLKDNMNILQKQDFSIFRRLELYLYTLFSSEFKDKIEKSLVEYFDNVDLHHEYYNLIKKAFNKTSKEIQDKIYDLIDKGFDTEKFERRKTEYSEEVAKTQERYWKFSKFESIAEYLDENHEKLYSELTKDFDPPEHPSFLSYHTTGIGVPTTDHKIFESKSIDEVFEKIKNHKISNDPFEHEDTVVRTFGEYVVENSLECSEKSFELKDIEPIFQYELFSGLKQAIQKNSKLDWNGVLQLIEYNISICLNDKNYVAKSFDYISKIYSLLEEAFKKNSIEFSFKERLWDILKLLLEIGTRCQESEDYPNKQNDSLTISINNINGLSFHVIYQYAVWYESNSESKRFLVPEVKQVFVDYLDKKLGEHTVSRHAVLGIFLPNFYYLDQTFVKEILKKVVSSKNTKIAFWDAYVSWNNISGYVFTDLYAWYREFLQGNLIQNISREQPYKATIDHMILAYLYDLKNADDIFVKFLNDDKESTIEHCVSQLAYIMKDKEGDEKFNKDKLIKLWKHPSILKQNLYLWFRNSPLDQKTTIELYLNYLHQYSEKINLVYAPISELQKCVKDAPQEVAGCIEIFIDKQENNYIPKEIKEILKSLLEIKNTDINTKCQKIIEKLATLGHDWRDLIND